MTNEEGLVLSSVFSFLLICLLIYIYMGWFE